MVQNNQENAESFANQSKTLYPTLSDLAKIGFSQHLIKKKIETRSGNPVGTTPNQGNNFDKGDLLVLEDGGRILSEPYEGVKISDISNLYPKQSISDLQEHGGRSMILNYLLLYNLV